MSWRNKARKEALDQLGTGATNRVIRFNMAVRLIARGARAAVAVVGKAIAVGKALAGK